MEGIERWVPRKWPSEASEASNFKNRVWKYKAKRGWESSRVLCKSEDLCSNDGDTWRGDHKLYYSE